MRQKLRQDPLLPRVPDSGRNVRLWRMSCVLRFHPAAIGKGVILRLVHLRSGWVTAVLGATVIAVLLLISASMDGGWHWSLLLPAVVVAFMWWVGWKRQKA
jgi:hypothetical protein